MQVTYTGRNCDLNERDKAKLLPRFEKIHRILSPPSRPLEAHVVLSRQRHLCEAEVTLRALNHTMVVTGTHAHPLQALKTALEKLEKQAKRDKTRIIERYRPLRQRDEPPKPVEVVLSETEPPEPVEDGQAPAIVRRTNLYPKPITLEEAQLQLEESGRDQVAYRDADSGMLCVLFRRRDGALELVEAG